MEKGVFTCRLCGECCRGSGGIVLRAKDILRLASHMGLEEGVFLTRFAERHAEKYRLRSQASGSCIFWDEANACTIHAAKPDVCRAWPFFRGNLADAVSMRMASQACPGIRSAARHADFARGGAAWLMSMGVYLEAGEEHAPHALMTLDELAALREKR